MHNFILSTVFIFLTFSLIAQTEGKISYAQTVKLDIQIEGLDEAMLEMIPKSQTINKELLFKKDISVFQNQSGESAEDIDLSSDDGSFQIKIMTDDTEDILYKSMKDKSQIHQKGIMGKSFIVEEKLPKQKWKITTEKVKYLDYECQKAVIEEEGNFVVAWFTSQLPVQAGPGSFHGLPGAILMVSVNDGESEYKATKVDFTVLGDDAIKIPDEGKKVTQEEFEKIVKEKEAEMQEMHGSFDH